MIFWQGWKLIEKERSQAYCGSWKKVTVTGGKVSCHIRMAWHKRNIKDCTRANVVQFQRGWTFGRRCQPKLECSKSIRRQDVEEPLHVRKVRKTANSIGERSRRQHPQLESMGKSNEVFRKTTGMEFGK
jgi:hypothetical protein